MKQPEDPCPVATQPLLSYRSNGRDNHFNLLRMLAAAGVLISHAYPISLGPSAIQPLQSSLKGTTLGTVCVMIFFAISGFFITRSFDRKTSLRVFFVARGLRLFPALIVVLIITLVFSSLFLTHAPQAVFWAAADSYLLQNVTLFQPKYALPGVFEANPYGPAINGSLWTLSYEVLCYTGVVLSGLFGLLRWKRAFGWALFILVIFYGASMAFELPPRIEALLMLALPFAIGMAFYVWRNAIPLSGLLAAGFCAVAVLSWWTPVFLPVFSLALAYAIFFIGYSNNLLALRYNKLGDYSYGTYIYAFPIQQLVASIGVASPAANIAIALPLTLICAVLSWHFVEYPAMNLRHRVGGSRRVRREKTTR